MGARKGRKVIKMESTIWITHEDGTRTCETRTLQQAKTTVRNSGKSVLDLTNYPDPDMCEKGSKGYEEIVAARCIKHYEGLSQIIFIA